MILEYKGKKPKIAATAFVASNATLIGDVEIGEQASVWFGAVLRGDLAPIRIGARSNIQDGTIIHSDPGFPVVVGEDVTVGHGVILHGCIVKDGALVGIGAKVLDGAVIGHGALIGSNALITPNKVVPDGALVMGSPGKVVRELSGSEIQELKHGVDLYVASASEYIAIEWATSTRG
jgi:carbonic anhydrase/acetyltransferase-like protein (isoleucine patch superfamily)